MSLIDYTTIVILMTMLVTALFIRYNVFSDMTGLNILSMVRLLVLLIIAYFIAGIITTVLLVLLYPEYTT